MAAVPNPSATFKGKPGVATVHIGVGGDASLVQSITLTWDATLTGAITVWTTDFPDGPTASPPAGTVALTSATNGDGWVQQQPTAGYTAISPVGAATVGASPLILNIPGGTAGSANFQIGNLGSMRLRLRGVFTVDGLLIVQPHGKE
jgi:hypothetical protein